MDKIRNKKHMAYGSLKQFFEDHGDDLAATYPTIGNARTTFMTKYAAMIEPIDNINPHTKAETVGKKQLKDECFDIIWKLVLAMKYHFADTKDKVNADLVKIARTTLAKLSESKFYNFCQAVMNLYDPAIYNAFNVDEAKMDALKLKLTHFPNKMRAVVDTRVITKDAVSDLIEKQRDMDYFLKNGVTPLIDLIEDDFPAEKIQYYKAIHIGIVSATKGKPHKKAKLASGEVMLLDKAKFRNKLRIIVKNNGKTPLMAGRSTNKNELQGAPFIIEPGKTRMRISQKLGSTGEFILIQNVGDAEGNFAVWLKETD